MIKILMQERFFVQYFMHDRLYIHVSKNFLQICIIQRNKVESLTRGANILVKTLYCNMKEKKECSAYLFAEMYLILLQDLTIPFEKNRLSLSRNRWMWCGKFSMKERRERKTLFPEDKASFFSLSWFEWYIVGIIKSTPSNLNLPLMIQYVIQINYMKSFGN